jgi:hypothetical protein
MTPVDLAGDSLGAFQAVQVTLASLDAHFAALLDVVIVGLCILIAVEVARGVMRR